MIKQDVTFEDFDGNEVTEEHYFHLSTAQIMEWIAEKGDDLGTQMEETVKSGDAGKIIALFTELIEKSYGRREGTSFVRSPEISKNFMTSLAGDALFGEILTNVDRATSFFDGIMPKKMIQQLQSKTIAPGVTQVSLENVDNEAQEDARSGLRTPRDNDGKLLPWAHRKPTQAELRKMNKEQMLDVHNRMSSGWEPTVESV